MQCVALFWGGTKNIHKTQNKNSDMSQNKQSCETVKYPQLILNNIVSLDRQADIAATVAAYTL